MATTIQQAFGEFLSNLEITDRQEALVSQRRRSTVAALARELTLHPEESKLIGSYDRHTLIRYLSEGDVDVMVILHHGENDQWHNAAGTTGVLDRFKAILDRAFPNTEKRRDRNCISMKFSEFRLDVVPAFKYNEGYYVIPDSVRRAWIPTDPPGFAERITQANKQMDGTFVPLMKMVKAWNRAVGWPIRSFHVECMMHAHFQTYTQRYTYPSMLCAFLGALPRYLAGPRFDPVTGDRVDAYLDNSARETDRQIAIKKAEAATDAAEEAHSDQDKYPVVAIGEWKRLMGEFFPAYG
jgi:hypothetical protein